MSFRGLLSSRRSELVFFHVSLEPQFMKTSFFQSIHLPILVNYNVIPQALRSSIYQNFLFWWQSAFLNCSSPKHLHWLSHVTGTFNPGRTLGSCTRTFVSEKSYLKNGSSFTHMRVSIEILVCGWCLLG